MEKFLLSLLCLLTVAFAGTAEEISFADGVPTNWEKTGTTTNQSDRVGKACLQLQKDATLTSPKYEDVSSISLELNISSKASTLKIEQSTDGSTWTELKTIQKSECSTSKWTVFDINTIGDTTNGVYFKFTCATASYYISTFSYTIGTPEPVIPTYCEKPVYKVDGKAINGNSTNAFAGSIITVNCPTEGSTMLWNVTKNNDENPFKIEDGFEYTIPEDAQIGDVFTFSATACLIIDEERKEASDYLEVNIIEKKGTLENPYSISDVIAGKNELGNNIWIKGYIVGAISTSNKLETSTSIESNIALSDTKDDHNNNDPFNANAGLIAIQLSSKTKPRDGLNLKSNSDLIGHEVMIYGNNEAYFQHPGLKGSSKYILLSRIPEEPSLEVTEDVTLAENQIKINQNTNIKLNTNESVDIYYRLNGNDVNVPVALYEAVESESEHSHDGFTLYDESKGIDITQSHVSLELYSCNPITKAHSNETPALYEIQYVQSAVAEVEMAEGEAKYFDLQGREVKGTPESGIYVRVKNGKSTKVLIK